MRPLDVKLSIADGHPNPAGHALLARALFDGLRALPGGCAMDASGTNAEAS